MTLVISTLAVIVTWRLLARRRWSAKRRRLSECFARDYAIWKETGCPQAQAFAHQWHSAIARLERPKYPIPNNQ